jgi:hypothetical protein
LIRRVQSEADEAQQARLAERAIVNTGALEIWTARANAELMHQPLAHLVRQRTTFAQERRSSSDAAALAGVSLKIDDGP